MVKVKATTTTIIKSESKYSLMSEDKTCIAEPDLEALLLTYFLSEYF